MYSVSALGNDSSRFQEQLGQAISILKQGGIIAFPTDTVYGLGVASYNTSAIERIYQVKKRSKQLAIPLLVANEWQLREVVKSIPKIAKVLIKEFFPGPLTLVFHKSDRIADIITAGRDTVAIRIPSHPVPIALASGLGVPITGTSSNLSGEPSHLTATEVRAQLGDKLDMILETDQPLPGIASTIVDITGKVAKVLREGAITRERLEQVLGKVT
jgi:L-threonylcarbamoyladenylate synthase